MPLLIAGVCLWAAIHLVPSLAPGLKSAWRGKLGEGGYKGSFTLIVLSALALIIVGWRSAQPTLIYLPPEALRTLALALRYVRASSADDEGTLPDDQRCRRRHRARSRYA